MSPTFPVRRDRSLRVLVVSLEYSPQLSGGMGTHVLELSRGLGGAGHSCTVLAYAPDRPRVIRHPNEEIHLIAQTSRTGHGRGTIVGGILDFNRDLVQYAHRLVEERDELPDIIHYHNWGTYPAARELSRSLGVPRIGTIHFVADPIEGWWGQASDPEIVAQEAELFANERSLIAVSESIREILRTAYAVDPGAVEVVHNGLDPVRFELPGANPEELRELRAAVAAEGEKIVLFAGRLNLQKGVLALLEAVSRVIERTPNVRLLIAGAPDSRGFGQEVEQCFAKRANLEGRVEFLGKVPRRQLATLYQVADLAVVPSIYEPFGYAAIEAMAAAVPVVASDVGGLSEIIVHGETGLLVPVSIPASGGAHLIDVEALAESIDALVGDEARAAELGSAGQRSVARNFSHEGMTASTVLAYARTIRCEAERSERSSHLSQASS